VQSKQHMGDFETLTAVLLRFHDDVVSLGD